MSQDIDPEIDTLLERLRGRMPEPDELNVAADLLEEQGFPTVAEILREWPEVMDTAACCQTCRHWKDREIYRRRERFGVCGIDSKMCIFLDEGPICTKPEFCCNQHEPKG